MKIRNQLINNAEYIVRLNHDLRLRVQRFLPCSLQIINNGLQTIFHTYSERMFVWFKLPHGRVLGMAPDEIQALQRAHTGCSYGNDTPKVPNDMRYRYFRHSDNLCMHRVFIRIGCLHRQKCTGSFLLNVAELANVIAYQDERGISLSQLISSEIFFEHKEQKVKIRVESGFPNRSEVRFTFHSEAPVFLRFRVRIPDWADGLNTVFLNGEAQSIECAPNYWMTMEQMFQEGDQILLGMPQRLHFVPVDAQHPNLVALKYGAEVLTCNEMTVLVGDMEHPENWIQPVPGCPDDFETLPGHAGVDESAVRRFSPY